jgi:hypothetical protein
MQHSLVEIVECFQYSTRLFIITIRVERIAMMCHRESISGTFCLSSIDQRHNVGFYFEVTMRENGHGDWLQLHNNSPHKSCVCVWHTRELNAACCRSQGGQK